MKLLSRSIGIVVFLIPVFASPSVCAAAFSSDTYSVSGLSNAYAGSVTGTHDNSDMYFNPAVLNQFGKTQLTLGVIDFNANISTTVHSTTINGIDQIGNPNASPGQSTTLPNFSLSTPINAQWSVGLNVTSPFSLETRYSADSLARYHGLDTDIKTLNFNPMVSYKWSDQTSVGFGLERERIETTLIRNVAPSGVLGQYTGSNTDYGFNLGILSQITPDLKVGLGYRSAIHHTLDGNVNLSLGNLTLPSYEGKVNFTMPDLLTLGAAYQVNDKIEIATDIQRTGWSHISEFLINHVNPPPGNTDIAVLLPLRNSLMASLGLNYKLNEQWLLRSGVAYEKEAVNGDYTNVRFPDGNRIWLSFGAQYKVTKITTFDVGYTHQFMQNTSSHILEGPQTAGLNASYQQSDNVFGASLNIEW